MAESRSSAIPGAIGPSDRELAPTIATVASNNKVGRGIAFVSDIGQVFALAAGRRQATSDVVSFGAERPDASVRQITGRIIVTGVSLIQEKRF